MDCVGIEQLSSAWGFDCLVVSISLLMNPVLSGKIFCIFRKKITNSSLDYNLKIFSMKNGRFMTDYQILIVLKCLLSLF